MSFLNKKYWGGVAGVVAILALFYQVLSPSTEGNSADSSNANQVAGDNNDVKNNIVYMFNNFSEFNKNLIKTIPEKDKTNAEHVFKIAEDMIKASVVKENESLKEDIKKSISGLSLLKYQAAKPPFLVPAKKAQYLCDSRFLLSFDGSVSAGSRGAFFL